MDETNPIEQRRRIEEIETLTKEQELLEERLGYVEQRLGELTQESKGGDSSNEGDSSL
jgi:hypothetical protein